MTRGVTSDGTPWVSADEVFAEVLALNRERADACDRALQAVHNTLVCVLCDGCDNHDVWCARVALTAMRCEPRAWMDMLTGFM